MEIISLKYYSFCKKNSIVSPYTFAETRAIFVAVCWKDVHGSFLQGIAVKLCKRHMKQLSAAFCTVQETLFSVPWNSENTGKNDQLKPKHIS